MKKNIIVSAAILAGGALATYLFKKYSTCKTSDNNNEPMQRSHHVTNVFAKAKKHATDMA